MFLLVVIALLWALATLQGILSLVAGMRFYWFVRQATRNNPRGSGYAPRACIFLPCCGVDDRLSDTVAALSAQDYPDYEVIFAFESVEDPAYAAVGRWASDWQNHRWRRVVAGRAEHCSQKIHNLLAALNVVGADREVYVFLDSDAVPPRDWLAHLIAPLADKDVGAGTGFRWYTTNGGVASGIRSAWNAASVTFLHADRLNFCWGGSTSIRRETFESLGIAARWQRALSDDYQVTRAIRNARLRIRFVPQCLIPCLDSTTVHGFLTFARRQLIITRVCAPVLWRTGVALASNFILGATGVVGLAVYAYLHGMPELMWTAIAGFLVILLLASAKSTLRQLAVRRVLSWPNINWRDFIWDVVAVAPIGMLHLGLLLSSARTRRIVWRSTVYEMVSPDETVVLARTNPAPRSPRAEPAIGLS